MSDNTRMTDAQIDILCAMYGPALVVSFERMLEAEEEHRAFIRGLRSALVALGVIGGLVVFMWAVTR